MSAWGLSELLLRRIDLRLAGANWQRAGGKGQRPTPVKLPADTGRDPAKPATVKPSGDEVAQRLRNLGMFPVGDVRNPPPAAEETASAQELEAIAHAWWLEQQQNT